jgi:hypothetical protein
MEVFLFMNKTVKGIIGGGICLVVLAGGFAALKLTDKSDSTEDDDSLIAEESHVFYEHDSSEVNRVEVVNSEGGYNLYRTAEATDDESASYAIEGIEDYKANDTIMSTIPNNCSSMDALVLIDENPTDLSQYGLDDPSTQVTVYFDDDTTETFYIGDDSPVEGSYFKMADDDVVYTVDSTPLYVFTKNKNYFISRVCLETPDDDDYPIVENVTVQRADLDYDIVLEYDHRSDDEDYVGGTMATHIMTSPVYAYLNADNSEEITHGMFGLTGDSIVKLSPTEDELTVAGILDNPTCVVTMQCDDGNTYTLTIGDSYTSTSYGEDSAYTAYFGYFEGVDILFAFDESSLPWLDLKPTDITSQLVFGTYIYDISDLTIETADTTLKFEGSGDSDDYTVTLNGEDFDLNRYKSFYQALIKAPAEDLYIYEVSGDPVATVTINLQTGGDPDVVEFYKLDDRKCVIVHNGVPSFSCRWSFIEKALLPNIANINGEDDFVTNW